MYCPFCIQQKLSYQDTRVVNSRIIEENNIIKRRRKCEICERKFTTLERIDISLPPVVKNDGRREMFQLKKIENGIIKACQKRPVSTHQINKMAMEVEMELLDWRDSEVTTQSIGKMVMRKLKDLDAVAYVRFASVYKTFHDIEEFVKDLG